MEFTKVILKKTLWCWENREKKWDENSKKSHTWCTLTSQHSDIGVHISFSSSCLFSRKCKDKNKEQIPIGHALFRYQNPLLVDDQKENVR